MSYHLIDLPLENYKRVLTSSTPLYMSMGALTAADATTLSACVVVSAFSGTSANMYFQESYDNGTTWTDVTSFTADLIGGTGNFKIKVNPQNGPLSPLVRLKILPAGATLVGISKIWKTFVQSNVMVPRDISPAVGVATEATLSLIKTNTDTIITDIGTVNTNLGLINTQLTNFDRNTGAASDNTLRTVLATRHETVTTPLANRLSDGTDFISAGAIAASQKTLSTVTKALDTVSFMMGWDGVNTHREIAVDTAGLVKTTNTDLINKLAGSFVPVAFDYSALTPAALTDTWVYKTGGAGGTTVKTVVITFSGADKNVIVSIAAT